jgi:hypothetical protein
MATAPTGSAAAAFHSRTINPCASRRRLAGATGTPLIDIHGDVYIGQVLRHPGGCASRTSTPAPSSGKGRPAAVHAWIACAQQVFLGTHRHALATAGEVGLPGGEPGRVPPAGQTSLR